VLKDFSGAESDSLEHRREYVRELQGAYVFDSGKFSACDNFLTKNASYSKQIERLQIQATANKVIQSHW